MTYIIRRRTEHTSNVWRGILIYQTKQEAKKSLSGMNKTTFKMYIHSVEKF